MLYREAINVARNHWSFLAVANGEARCAYSESRTVTTPKAARRALRMAQAILSEHPTYGNEQERFNLAAAMGRLGAGSKYCQLNG